MGRCDPSSARIFFRFNIITQNFAFAKPLTPFGHLRDSLFNAHRRNLYRSHNIVTRIPVSQIKIYRVFDKLERHLRL